MLSEKEIFRAFIQCSQKKTKHVTEMDGKESKAKKVLKNSR